MKPNLFLTTILSLCACVGLHLSAQTQSTQAATRENKNGPTGFEPFVITDDHLIDRALAHNEAKIRFYPDEDGAVQFEGNVTMSMKDGNFEPVFWADGIQHTWVGKLNIMGYVFDGDQNDPLQFKIDKNRGYVYLKGKGTVTLPNKETVVLPKTKAASTPISQPADSSAHAASNSRSWKAIAPNFGSFELTADSTGQTITRVAFQFQKLSCGSVQEVSGGVEATGEWPITNREFTVTISPPPSLKITITGRFSRNRQSAAGTWKANSDGTVCSGNWVAK